MAGDAIQTVEENYYDSRQLSFDYYRIYHHCHSIVQSFSVRAPVHVCEWILSHGIASSFSANLLRVQSHTHTERRMTFLLIFISQKVGKQ